jgi:hypothetical protein
VAAISLLKSGEANKALEGKAATIVAVEISPPDSEAVKLISAEQGH